MRNLIRMTLATMALLLCGSPARAVCFITGIQSISGLTANLGAYDVTAPTTVTLNLTLVLNKFGNGTCNGTLAFQGSVSPAQMTGPGTPRLNYNVMNTGGTSILYTGSPGTRVSFSRINDNQNTVTIPGVQVTVRAIAGQTGRPAGNYSDTSVIARVFLGNSNFQLGGASPVLNVSSTVVAACTVGGVSNPTSDSATIPVSSAGVVNTSVINKSYANVSCNAPANVQLSSLNGAVKASASAVSGFSNFINYSATASFFGANATLNTATIPAASGTETGSAASTTSGSPNGTMSVSITPASATSRLLAGGYSDTLRVTITPQ